MEYELKELEHIIQTVLNPITIKREALNKFIGECKLHAETEKGRICNQFRLMLFSGQKQKKLELYYQKHQLMLVQLIDKVYHYIDTVQTKSIEKLTDDERILQFYKELMQVPEDLLDFIEKHFHEYFDNDCKLPETKRWQYEQQIKRDLNGIKKATAKLDIYNGLSKIVYSPFEQYLIPGEGISYREIAYLLKLQTELITFTKIKHEQNADELLCQLLLQLNFNSLRFFNYYIERMQERSRLFVGLPDLIGFYSLELKINNQLAVRPGLVYKHALPAIREQIGSWICEELYFLEKRQRLLSLVTIEKTDEQTALAKVHTSLSVSQLALAVKLLIDSKVITNKNAAELMRVVASSFRTDRQEIISEESLRNKSYSFETTTVNRLKDEIIGLLNLVRKY